MATSKEVIMRYLTGDYYKDLIVITVNGAHQREITRLETETTEEFIVRGFAYFNQQVNNG